MDGSVNNMKKNVSQKTLTYALFGGVVFLLIMSIGVTIMLRADSTSAPIATTKIRASGLTYRKTIFIVNVTSTPTKDEPTPTEIAQEDITTTPGATDSGRIVSNNSQTGGTSGTSGTPTSTASGKLLTSTPTKSPTRTPTIDPSITDADVTVTITGTVTPSVKVTSSTLPESGDVQYPMILFISASVFLFVSFLF